MRRVRNNNIRLRHALHHSPPCRLLHPLALLWLDLWISFLILILIFDFLLCHTQVFFMFPFLEHPVSKRKCQICHRYLDAKLHHHVKQDSKTILYRQIIRRHKNSDIILDNRICHCRKNNDFKDWQHQLEQWLFGKHTLKSTDWTQLVKFRFHRFWCHLPRDLDSLW